MYFNVLLIIKDILGYLCTIATVELHFGGSLIIVLLQILSLSHYRLRLE